MASLEGDHVKCSNEEDNPDDENIGDPDEDDEYEQEAVDCDVPEGSVRIRPSCIPTILPPTIYVDYPPELGIRREDICEIVELGIKKLQYKSHWERICIRNAFKRAGFTKGGKHWTAIWSKHQSQAQLNGLNCLQKVNHFPASWCIGRKDRLSRTLQSMKRLHGKEFDFHPDTFIMPQDREAFHRAIKNELEQSIRKAKKNLWIVKPCASSCGRGISVVTSSQAWNIAEKKKVLIQRYLNNPYLINHKKFDLRIYVLVTGVDPLRVYIHSEGLTRISTSDYNLNNITNRFAHLTNYSVNKKADVFKAAAYDAPSDHQPSEDVEGFKWSLKAFKRWLAEKEGTQRMEEVFAKIHDICVKTIIAAEGEITPQLQRSVLYRTNCFELFGMDVILDEHLNPQLLEVNVSPSLMGSSPLDKRIKGMMIADVLHTVGLYAYDIDLLKKYTQDTAQGKSSDGNPFAFCNLSRLLTCQDSYRRNPCGNTVDLSALKDMDENCGLEYCNWWQMLLMIEDEFARSKSSGFQLIHPTLQQASHYTSLYRNSRFSDQMLAKWVGLGGIGGRAVNYLPNAIRAHLRRGFQSNEPEPTSGEKVINPRRPTSAAPCRSQVNSAEKSEDDVRRPSSAARSRPKPSNGDRGVHSINDYLSSNTCNLHQYITNNERQSEGMIGQIDEIQQTSFSDWGLISRINRNIVLRRGNGGSNNTGPSSGRKGRPTGTHFPISTAHVQLTHENS